MPPKRQASRRVTLTAGEEYTLTGNGLVEITLQTGVLDVAGVLLEANHPYKFFLRTGSRSLVLFTLEGGSCIISSEHKLDLVSGVAKAAPLVQLVRRTLLPAEESKVLVIGHQGSGKTLASHTLCNLLMRYGSDKKSVFLLDFNAESNSIYAPGCVSGVQVGETPLWSGLTSLPTLVPLSLYTGAAVRPTARNVSSFLHYCDQLHETATSWFRELGNLAPGQRQKVHIVMDAPSPMDDLQEGVLYKKMIEMLRPTHVVVIGGPESSKENWSTFLQEDVQRVLPDCEFSFAESITHRCTASLRRQLLQEYFTGTPFYALGCSKVVVPLKSVQFVEEEDAEVTISSGGDAVVMRSVRPDASFRFLVCALSHAQLVEEAPLAPIAGLVTIVYVDEENEEVALIIPAAEEPLQRRIIIVPHTFHRDSLRATEAQVATMEECVAV